MVAKSARTGYVSKVLHYGLQSACVADLSPALEWSVGPACWNLWCCSRSIEVRFLSCQELSLHCWTNGTCRPLAGHLLLPLSGSIVEEPHLHQEEDGQSGAAPESEPPGQSAPQARHGHDRSSTRKAFKATLAAGFQILPSPACEAEVDHVQANASPVEAVVDHSRHGAPLVFAQQDSLVRLCRDSIMRQLPLIWLSSYRRSQPHQKPAELIFDVFQLNRALEKLQRLSCFMFNYSWKLESTHAPQLWGKTPAMTCSDCLVPWCDVAVRLSRG